MIKVVSREIKAALTVWASKKFNAQETHDQKTASDTKVVKST